MQHKIRNALLIGSLFFLLLIIVACASEQFAPVTQQPEATSAQKTAAAPAAAKPEAPPAPKPEVKPQSPYAMEIAPLTPADCARCHPSVFNMIKNDGGKHKIDCVRCHTKFHVYNPVKQNWDDIMPKCQTCHGLIHGQKFAACSGCHSEPHAPKKEIAGAELNKVCGDCHTKVGQELQLNPSKHTKVDCAMCHHTKHGFIPSCMECHKPHSSDQTVKDCLACHPVHSPLKITYADTVKNEVCGACHAPVYSKIKATTSKHGQVACAKCHHSKHKYIPQCKECHGQPHGEVVLKKFPNCLQCHIDVHDLPSKSGKK